MENFLLWDRNVDDGLPSCPRQVLIEESEIIATKLWKDKKQKFQKREIVRSIPVL